MSNLIIVRFRSSVYSLVHTFTEKAVESRKWLDNYLLAMLIALLPAMPQAASMASNSSTWWKGAASTNQLKKC